ncbi:YIP1 family protein [Calditrichota bacterium]
MTEETTESKEIGVVGRIIGIFTSPTETLQSIDQKPNWIIPFLIGIICFLIFQYSTLDIQMQYQIAKLEARDLPAEQLDIAKNQMQGPMKYLGFIVGPIMVPIIWAIFAGLFLLAGNWMIGGQTSFKKLFSMVAWVSLIGSLSLILLTFLIVSKGTIHGIAMDLSVLLTTPDIGEETSLLHRIFSKIDLFVIWQVVLWTIGMSVAYKTTTKKAAVPILSLWGLWIVVSVTFGSLFGDKLGM